MTQITGKIYQETNAAGTENRFPRTVMEAVLGLNSYLQTQFANLADIYMPIEGITETKQGQEFVYRKTPNTIKAKSFVLDRIKGKTLAWNQLVPDTLINYTNEQYDNRTYFDAYVQWFNNSSEYMGQNELAGDVGYHSYILTSPNGSETCLFKHNGQSLDLSIIPIYYIPVVAGHRYYFGYYTKSADPTTVGGLIINNLRFIDLTILYGSAIDGLTDAQILAKFESEFGGYHDYNPGQLISNDAESIETVGFNLWDEEYLNGYWNIYLNNAPFVYSANEMCTKNFIPVIAGEAYYVNIGSETFTDHIAFYDANKNFVGETSYSNKTTISIPAGVFYIKVNFGNNVGSVYQNNVCINLSDPAKNGTYEPYRKSTMQLGLDSIKVKSPNIWDEEVELGYYNENDGTFVSASGELCTKNLVPVEPNTTYYCNVGNCVIFYDANGNYISGIGSWTGGNTFTTPSNALFVHIDFGGGYGSTYNNDICINKSDPAFNGRYFPHGILTIEGGLGSARDCSDEIIGTKLYRRLYRKVFDGTETYWSYDAGVFFTGTSGGTLPAAMLTSQSGGRGNGISRFGLNVQYSTGVPPTGEWDLIDSFTSWGIAFNASLSGQTTVDGWKDYLAENPLEVRYQLANVEVYDLAEPLVPTVKAGTTEARISPNADGLSAPFCADMTYSASENNDSASAQYALTAGRLLNSHKIWGQDFDGTGDVSGNLVSNGTLTGTRLISTVATGTAPLTVASTTEVANLHAYTATKLHTARTIWGQSFDGTGNISDNFYTTNYIFLASGSRGPYITQNGVFVHDANNAWDADFIRWDTTNLRVGIGTTSPQYKLDVDGTIAARSDVKSVGLCIYGDSGNITNNWYYTKIATVYEEVPPTYQNGAMVFYTMHETYSAGSEVERMRITSNGRIGIGNPSPSYKLDVDGSIRSTSQLISTVATGTAPLSIASTTRVANLNADLLDGYEASEFTSAIQSLWSQLDSVSSRTGYDYLTVTELLADTFSASNAYLATLDTTGSVTLGSTLAVAGNTTLSGALSVSSLLTAISGLKLTTTKKIWFGDTYYIELDSNNRLHTNAAIVSDSSITAGTAAS